MTVSAQHSTSVTSFVIAILFNSLQSPTCKILSAKDNAQRARNPLPPEPRPSKVFKKPSRVKSPLRLRCVSLTWCSPFLNDPAETVLRSYNCSSFDSNVDPVALAFSNGSAISSKRARIRDGLVLPFSSSHSVLAMYSPLPNSPPSITLISFSDSRLLSTPLG